MAEYLIQDTTLNAIADAVRRIIGVTEKLTLERIVDELDNIWYSVKNVEVIVTDYVQSETANTTTFEIYNGPVDWNTQSLVMEFAIDNTNVDGIVFNIGTNITTLMNTFYFRPWYYDDRQYFSVGAQGDVAGGWGQFNSGYVNNVITDWSNIKLEVNKNGMFVNGNDIAEFANDQNAYSDILNMLLSGETLQIGNLMDVGNLHPITFKSVYFYKLS